MSAQRRAKGTEGPSKPPSPGEIFGRRLREVRKRRGWSQQQLADRLGQIGYPMNRVTIAKIETNAKRAAHVELQEIFAIAAALSVAPVHLFFPLDEEEKVQIARHTLTSAEARDWLRGGMPLEGADVATYFGERPTNEIRALLELQRKEEERSA